MKSVSFLTEQDITRIVRLVLEQEDIDLEGYDDLDFIDAFNRVFVDWLRKEKKILVFDYPFSFLLKKYGKEFVIHYGLYEPEEQDDDEEFSISRWDLMNYGRKLIIGKVLRYPTLRETGYFLEKFEKAIEKFIKIKHYPSYITVKLREEKPFILNQIFEIDLERGLKDSNNFKLDKYKENQDLANFIKNFLGLEISSPNYGGLKLEEPIVIIKDKEEFIKNVVNKEIKKQIRELPLRNLIHSIKLEFWQDARLTIKLTFKYIAHYQQKRDIVDKTKEIVTKLGFNPQKIKVEI